MSKPRTSTIPLTHPFRSRLFPFPPLLVLTLVLILALLARSPVYGKSELVFKLRQPIMPWLSCAWMSGRRSNTSIARLRIDD